MDCSIIIVTYNTLELTSQCIDSIISKTEGIDYEILVVDNASSDASGEHFSADPRIKYIRSDENLGFGRANNLGLEHSRGRNILFLNSDTVLRNNAIRIMSDFLDANPSSGACGGNLFTRDGLPNYSFDLHLPGISTELDLLLRNLIYRKEPFFNTSGKPMKVAGIIGADLMVKSSVLKETGAFNPSFFLYYEETELCFRIARAGYSLYSVPQAEITHLWGASTKFSEQQVLYLTRKERSRTIYYSLTHFRLYFTMANALRSVAVATKLLSPSPEVRNKWKLRRSIFRQVRQEFKDGRTH